MTAYHSFEHEAMATTFTIRIEDPRAEYARQAAMEAFRECDRLEEHLSRFVSGSSINRLNQSRVGEFLRINADAYLCLRQALHIAAVTDGAFDIGYRSRAAGSSYTPAIELSDEEIGVRLLRDAPDLDLGGVGKGYAIDKMAAVLAEWEVGPALVSGGWSTVLAAGNPAESPGWPVQVNGQSAQTHALPDGWALSASGFSVQEEHVRDPRTGLKADLLERAWAIAPSAAVSDALSTVFLVLTEAAIDELLEAFTDIGAVLQLKNGSVKSIGKVIPPL